MAKRPRIEPGDWLSLRPQRVVATWEDDGKVTIEFLGQRVTLRQDSDEIEEVVKGEKPEAVRKKRGTLYDRAD